MKILTPKFLPFKVRACWNFRMITARKLAGMGNVCIRVSQQSVVSAMQATYWWFLVRESCVPISIGQVYSSCK